MFRFELLSITIFLTKISGRSLLGTSLGGVILLSFIIDFLILMNLIALCYSCLDKFWLDTSSLHSIAIALCFYQWPIGLSWSIDPVISYKKSAFLPYLSASYVEQYDAQAFSSRRGHISRLLARYGLTIVDLILMKAGIYSSFGPSTLIAGIKSSIMILLHPFSVNIRRQYIPNSLGIWSLKYSARRKSHPLMAYKTCAKYYEEYFPEKIVKLDDYYTVFLRMSFLPWKIIGILFHTIYVPICCLQIAFVFCTVKTEEQTGGNMLSVNLSQILPFLDLELLFSISDSMALNFLSTDVLAWSQGRSTFSSFSMDLLRIEVLDLDLFIMDKLLTFW